jgi:hypothetical protein
MHCLPCWPSLRSYEQRLRFTKEKANQYARFAIHVKARPKVFPDLPTLKRILACADSEQRTWIWISLGCGFEPIALAQATRRCFDQEMYDLIRSKTGLLRRGKMRPMVWACAELRHLQAVRPIRDAVQQAHDRVDPQHARPAGCRCVAIRRAGGSA